MTGRNLCAVLHGAGDLRVEERPIPSPAKGEVQVNIRSVGICGSDLALYRTGRVGMFPLQEPIILGHEPCGVISGVGHGVTNFAVGDRVVLHPHYSCGACRVCQDGRYNLCRDARMMATPPTNGILANFVVLPAQLCYKMPPELTWEEGAFVQPMALALYGCERAGVKPGQHVLICGAGPLGIVMVVAAKACGATRICVTDIAQDRLDFLSEKCGCATYRADDGSPRDVADKVTSILDGTVDVTLECSGAPSAVATGIYATKPGGVILLAGIGPAEVTIPLLAAATKEVDIRSMLRFTNTYPAALELMASGQIDVKPLVTHKFPLSQAVDALEAMSNKTQGKIIIECSSD